MFDENQLIKVTTEEGFEFRNLKEAVTKELEAAGFTIEDWEKYHTLEADDFEVEYGETRGNELTDVIQNIVELFELG